jgi:hypothetical protein
MQTWESSRLCLRLESAVLRPALRAGVENIVFLLLVVSALIDDDQDCSVIELFSRDTRDQLPAPIAASVQGEMPKWKGIRDIELYLKVPRGASYTFHRDMSQVDGIWKPPDLPEGAQTIGVARILLPARDLPANGDSVRIDSRLRGVPFNEQIMTTTGTTFTLPVVGADEYAATPEDENVREILEESAGFEDASWGPAPMPGDRVLIH